MKATWPPWNFNFKYSKEVNHPMNASFRQGIILRAISRRMSFQDNLRDQLVEREEGYYTVLRDGFP